MTSAALLRLELRGSPGLTLLTAAVHAAAGASLMLVLPPLPGATAAFLLVVLALLVIRERTLLRSARAPAELEIWPDGILVLQLRDGTRLSGRALPRRYVSRWLVTLSVAIPEGRERTLLVARDMLGAGEFRRLCLWALWNALPARFSAPAT